MTVCWSVLRTSLVMETSNFRQLKLCSNIFILALLDPCQLTAPATPQKTRAVVSRRRDLFETHKILRAAHQDSLQQWGFEAVSVSCTGLKAQAAAKFFATAVLALLASASQTDTQTVFIKVDYFWQTSCLLYLGVILQQKSHDHLCWTDEPF